MSGADVSRCANERNGRGNLAWTLSRAWVQGRARRAAAGPRPARPGCCRRAGACWLKSSFPARLRQPGAATGVAVRDDLLVAPRVQRGPAPGDLVVGNVERTGQVTIGVFLGTAHVDDQRRLVPAMRAARSAGATGASPARAPGATEQQQEGEHHLRSVAMGISGSAPRGRSIAPGAPRRPPRTVDSGRAQGREQGLDVRRQRLEQGPPRRRHQWAH